MIWATVSSQSCFCWLYRASPSLATKNIINLISVLTIWWCQCVVLSMCSLLLCCWKRAFAMTSAFTWQNSISLYPASFHIPRPNLPVTPGVSWTSPVAQRLKHLPAMQETWVWSLGREDPLEKGMATHFQVSLPGESPWTEESGRLPSMGSQRVRQDWETHMRYASTLKEGQHTHLRVGFLWWLILTRTRRERETQKNRDLTSAPQPCDQGQHQKRWVVLTGCTLDMIWWE